MNAPDGNRGPRMPWGRFWWGSWRGDIRVAELSLSARGLAVELRGIAHEQGNPLPPSSVEPERLARLLREPKASVEKGLREIRRVGLLREVDGKPYLTLFEAEDRMARNKSKAGQASADARHGAPPPAPPPGRKETDTDTDTEAVANSAANTVPNSKGGDQGFGAFWKQYPKKDNKEEAAAEWAAIAPDAATVARILRALEVFKDSHDWTKELGRYIPKAEKWLAERKWELVPEAKAKGATPFSQLPEGAQRQWREAVIAQAKASASKPDLTNGDVYAEVIADAHSNCRCFHGGDYEQHTRALGGL